MHLFTVDKVNYCGLNQKRKRKTQTSESLQSKQALLDKWIGKCILQVQNEHHLPMCSYSVPTHSVFVCALFYLLYSKDVLTWCVLLDYVFGILYLKKKEKKKKVS